MSGFVHKTLKIVVIIGSALAGFGCGTAPQPPSTPVITSLKEVPSVRLNFRYEPDVPPPGDSRGKAADERNSAVQAHFDQARPQELLDRTLPSPDGKRIIAIYHLPTDTPSEFRLDMYSADGVLLRKVTPEAMAVHFADTIVWSPDSVSVAFVAMTRGASTLPTPTPPDGGSAMAKPTPGAPSPDQTANSNSEAPPADPEANANADLPPAAATPAPAPNVLTFRTEQIYICDANGENVKPLTQNEGLIYFYYVWSPDGSMLAALAATGREWQYLELQAGQNKEQYVPIGRPRVIEKNGRERRLDDGLTAVQPIWSPDSAKIACAFKDQVRIYDSRGDNPTQAAIPLRNNLLLSSQAFDRDQQTKLNTENSNSTVDPNIASSASNTNVPANTPATTLPDEKDLVSFNPIVLLSWPTEDQLYFQTAFVKRMKNDADSVMSFPRWHRLILTPQPAAIGK